MNRDERLSRRPAGPPRVIRLGDGEAIAPRDGQAGGTWIGVNSHGLAVALANVYSDPAPPMPEARISRGMLVSEALRCRDQVAVLTLLEMKTLSRYEPFQLIAFAPGCLPQSSLWDGSAHSVISHSAPGLITTSSSRDQEGASRIRGALFANAAEGASGLTPQVLDELHRSREPEPGPYAISMERSDAGTVSMSVIRVSADRASFSYTPGPPHRTEADPALMIHRSTAVTTAVVADPASSSD